MAIIYNPDDVAGKVCNICKDWKPLSEFHRHSQARDGYKADCKVCRNAALRAADAVKREQRRSNNTPNIKPAITGKVCVGCREWKPVSEFSPLHWKGKPLGNGYRSRCKACSNAQQRAKRAAQPELYRGKAREYMASRHEHSAEYQRSWRDKNREKVRSSGRAYRQTHPERYREQVRTRRNRKYQAEGFHTEAEWEALKAKYNYTCLRCCHCEPEITLTRDHVIPLTQGGSDWITNIQPLCHICNSSKNNKSIDYRVDWNLTGHINSETSADP